MRTPRPGCLILAETPAALVSLCGISILERLLRILQRLEFEQVTLLANSPIPIRDELEKPSWARARLHIEFEQQRSGALTLGEIKPAWFRESSRLLVVPGDHYFDARLLDVLSRSTEPTVLIDSAPPPALDCLWRDASAHTSPRISGAALVTAKWLSQQDKDESFGNVLKGATLRRIDAMNVPGYLRDQRATVRPVFFPAPQQDKRRLAERVVRRAAQKGTLDIPAMVHAPIETWIVAKLCSTRIRPNHLSALTMICGLTVTALYASGRLGAGVMLALVIGVLDGLDGKLARTKVETTELGKWEHEVDYFVETTWWLALAFHFAASNAVDHMWVLWGVLFSCEFIDRSTRGWIKKRLDRNLDDVSRFDRLVRLIGARRNIYTWILAVGMIVGEPAKAFVIICYWGIATAIIHVTRALQLARVSPVGAES